MIVITKEGIIKFNLNLIKCCLFYIHHYANVEVTGSLNRRKEVEDINVQGLRKVKQEGLQIIASKYPNIPAVKRHMENPESKMQFATAYYLHMETGVALENIIE